jgi:hypothetical protein
MIRVVLDTNILFSAIFKSAGMQAKIVFSPTAQSRLACLPLSWSNTMKCCIVPFFDSTPQK